MELLQLRYFFESAKNENFAKTAEKYWVPASSVSASIKRLEQELGCKLFDRKSNRIYLNENGRRLQSSLGAIFDELDYTVNALKQDPPPATEIRLLVRSLRERTMSAIIDYQKRYPNVRFYATFGIEEPTSSYDIIIDKGRENHPDYERFELCSFRLRIKTSKDSPLVGRTLTMQDLRHQPFVMMGSASDLSDPLIESCKNAGFYPNIVIQTNDAYFYKRCTIEGVGVCLWREYANDTSDNMEYLTVTDFQARETNYIYYKRNLMNETVKHFIDFLKATSF
ncbi:MAG: LysR family transcriptional regulator [Clostridia bacterium]|nr:LysR family transcriptional regulator [Clostridia bacterium]